MQKSNSLRGSYVLKVDQATPACECEVCGYVLKDDKDIEHFLDKGACSDCVDTYYYQNALKWNDGWRPTRNEVRKNDIQ
jgi:hypothetical protein